jgi:hypothetical protein
MKIKPKKCKVCKDIFTPTQPLQRVCTLKCAIEDGNKVKEKKWNKEKKERKEALKTNSDYVRELQVIFNKYIRLRDKDKGCISCNKPLIGKYDAGHFYSTGSYPELRFNEMNVHGQCVYCNQHQRGAIHNYTIGLENRFNYGVIATLKALINHPRKYTIPELKALKIKYKEKIKML